VTPEILARLLTVEVETGGEGEYLTLSRGLCFAIAHRSGSELALGSSGIMTERGLAYVVWKNGLPLLASKGALVDASAEQVAEIRKFSEDVKTALAGG
jgi:hypothetical protein